MKYFIVLFAVILAAHALPSRHPSFNDVSHFINNGTRVPAGQVGFATLNGGTFGGAGGAVWTVWDAWALRDAVSGNEPRIIYVRGRIDLTVLFTSSPGIALRVGDFKTIIGGDSNAMIFGGGLRIMDNRQVIIQNIKIHNALSYAPGEQPNGNGGIISQVPGAYSTVDGIGIEFATNIWVDHCEFADDPWVSSTIPESSRRHDGLIDIVRGANWVTISNSIFRNHNLVTLVGNDDNNGAQDSVALKVTFNLNWYQGTTQRNPRVRYGSVHILNNLYTDIRDYAIGLGAGASVYAERNSFVNTRRAWGFAAGTPNPIGNLFPFNNWFENSSNDNGIPSAVNWTPTQHYSYTPMGSNAVATYVRANAGTW